MIPPHDLYMDVWIGGSSPAQGAIGNLADCKVDGIDNIARADRVALIQVLKNLFKIGEGLLSVAEPHAIP